MSHDKIIQFNQERINSDTYNNKSTYIKNERKREWRSVLPETTLSTTTTTTAAAVTASSSHKGSILFDQFTDINEDDLNNHHYHHINSNKKQNRPEYNKDIEQLLQPLLNKLEGANGWLSKGILLLFLVIVALAIAFTSHKINHIEKKVAEEGCKCAEAHAIKLRLSKKEEEEGGGGGGGEEWKKEDIDDDDDDDDIEKKSPDDEEEEEFKPPMITGTRIIEGSFIIIQYRFPHSETNHNKFPTDGLILDLQPEELSAVTHTTLCCTTIDVAVKCTADVSISIGSSPHIISRSMSLSGICTLSLWTLIS